MLAWSPPTHEPNCVSKRGAVLCPGATSHLVVQRPTAYKRSCETCGVGFIRPLPSGFNKMKRRSNVVKLTQDTR